MVGVHGMQGIGAVNVFVDTPQPFRIVKVCCAPSDVKPDFVKLHVFPEPVIVALNVGPLSIEYCKVTGFVDELYVIVKVAE
jgi:hypothetical protein